MLRVVTGRFHPDLEQALLEDVHRRKAADALAPLTLVVPSASLVTHLRRRLVAGGQALLNVHLLTFHQLALRLYEEHREALDPPVSFRPIELLPELVLEHLIGRLATQKLDPVHPLRAATVGIGTWSVLWRTIRDLREADVDPLVAGRALAEGVFPQEDEPELSALFHLHAASSEVCRSLAVGLTDDLVPAVLPWVPHSEFLKTIGQTYYYGFYDLTQVQLALFEMVVGHVPVTLFFPLQEGPVFGFARRFYERHVNPLVAPAEQVRQMAKPREPPGGRPDAEHVQVLSAVGAEGELEAAAMQVLSLTETHGYRFDQIGVVARSLDPYVGALRRVFDGHRIPFTCSGASPLLWEPAVKVLLRLAALPVQDFAREAVLDVVTSVFRAPEDDRKEGGPRPDLWRLAVRRLGIIRGEGDWHRLAEVGEVGLGDESEEPGDRSSRGARVPPRQIRVLWGIVSGLLTDVRALPQAGTYAELTDAFVALAMRHLRVPGLAKANEVSDLRGLVVGATIEEALACLRRLDVLEERVSYATWFAALTRALEETRVPVMEHDCAGVQVLDAMTARGLRFDGLIIMGLNDGVFPRAIQEDPFLRDRHRRQLGETLGYKIDEKLNAYEEEHLLFTLLTQAARHRLCLLYQRADEEGLTVAPSPYLAEILDTRAAEVRVPRRLTERDTVPFCTPLHASAVELTLRAVLRNEDPSTLLEAAGRDGSLFRHGWHAMRRLETAPAQAGEHDGLTGRLDRHWDRVQTRGVAPTSLEQYARCPFQYFGAQVLRLEDLRGEVPDELPGQAWGSLMHAVLRSCYPVLCDRGWPAEHISNETLGQLIESAAAGEFEAYARHHGTGLPLVWLMTRERIRELVMHVVRADEQDLRRTGLRPVAFEAEGRGRLDLFEDPAEGVIVHGRLDRVDRREKPPALRVVDYKYRHGRDLKRRDSDLLTSAVRGLRLQPPLYARIDLKPVAGGAKGTPHEAACAGQVDFLYVVARSETVVQRATLDASMWNGETGAQLKRTLRLILDGIREGRFFILPDDGWEESYCDSCTFSAVCRRAHDPTWLRANAAAPARSLRQTRKQKAIHATADRDT